MNKEIRSEIKLKNSKKIGDFHKPYLIAEIGTNHNQNLNTAKNLIEEIAKAGFDCAKFQIYESDEIVSEILTTVDYKLDNLYGKISAADMFDKYLKTPKEWFPELIDFCHSLGLDCATTIHGSNGINWVKNLNFDLIKIASMDHNNFPFQKEIINNVKQPILISFGMAEINDIKKAIEILKEHQPGVGAFHCVSIYPASTKELRLSNIDFLKNNFSIPIGFSDHSDDVISSSLAFLLGACVFEKHVTLNRNSKGPDHPFALEPIHMIEYVESISSLYNDLKNKEFKFPTSKEIKNRKDYLKSVVAKKNLIKGDFINSNDVTLLRPGGGIPPSDYEKVIGKKAKRNIYKGNPINWNDLET